jgi:organic radical activating enzyme
VGTDGPSGGQYDAKGLAEAAAAHWEGAEPPFVVCTGGEPLLQMDGPLLAALHAERCVVAVETNGTLPVPQGVDWITVSPKMGAAMRQTSGNELKLVWPQDGPQGGPQGGDQGAPGLDPAQFEPCGFEHFFLQPMDSPKHPDALARCIEYCLKHPKWRLSVQLHKIIGIK